MSDFYTNQRRLQDYSRGAPTTPETTEEGVSPGNTEEYTAAIRKGILEGQERAHEVREQYGINLNLEEAGELANALDKGQLTEDGALNYLSSRVIAENLGKSGIAVTSQYVLEHLPEFQRLIVQNEEALKTPKTAFRAVFDGFVISGAQTRKATQSLQLMTARLSGNQEEIDLLERMRKREDEIIAEHSDYQKRFFTTEIGKVLRTLQKINTTYCASKVVVYNSNLCGICPFVVLSLTSVHQLYERPSRTCECLIHSGH